jgi:hypothetical protein
MSDTVSSESLRRTAHRIVKQYREGAASHTWEGPFRDAYRNKPLPAEDGITAVSPAMAAAWLRWRNTRNERHVLSTSKIADYALAMLTGKWTEHPHGLVFAKDGMQEDGQQRLLAILVAADRSPDFHSVNLYVHVGWRVGTAKMMDQGVRRSFAHTIDVPDPYAISAAISVLGAVTKEGRSAAAYRVRHPRLSIAEQRDLLAEWEKELLAALPYANRAYKKAGVPQATHLAILAQAMRGEHRDKVEPWAEALESGAGLEKGDPRLALRNRLARESHLTRSTHAEEAYRLIVRAWNAYVTGRPLHRIQSEMSQPAPKVL